MVGDPTSPHSSRYKSTARVHLAIMAAWWPMGKSSSCLSSSRGPEIKEPLQTWRRVAVALSCHAVVHLETVMSDLGAVFRSYSRACLAPAGHGMLCCKPAGSCRIIWEVDSSGNQTWQHIDPLWAQIMDPKMIQHSFCLYLPIFFPMKDYLFTRMTW